MSTKPQTPYSTPVDLEATADYPPITTPVAPAATADTWVMPQLAEAAVIDDLLRAHREEIGTLRESVAVLTTGRDQLQAQLTTLTAKLRELEQLLLAKTAQHSHQESELRARREEIGSLRQSLTAAATSRDQTQSNLTALASQLHELEQRPHETAAQRAQHATELQAQQEEIGSLRQSLAAATTSREQLQANLAALTSKLHELEQRPRESDEQRARHAAELQAQQQEIATLRQNLAVATSSREQLQAKLFALTTRIHDLEQLPRQTDEQRSRHERELGERDRRLAELTQELAARAEQQRLEGAERDQQRVHLERVQAELSSATQLRERQTSVQADTERERARRDAALARSQEDLTALQRRVAGLHEALHRAETRRQVFEAMLREREQMLDERDARVHVVQDESNILRREHGAARERATAELAAALARAAEAERQLTEQLQRAHARAPEQASGATVAPSADPHPRAHGAALEGELADLHEGMRALQEQLQNAQGANEALRGDLAAAELQIRSSESELQQSKARVTRLETEASASAQSLDTRRRLLVRTEGDTGIVHVLGRRTTIGRTPDNDLRIEADFISRHHAVVLVTEDSTVVEDLNSTNGVFVNAVAVSRHELREGDVLTIGNTSFRYVLKPAADRD
jgi:ParB family transcriptional regulator, chromosome partitioning protein